MEYAGLELPLQYQRDAIFLPSENFQNTSARAKKEAIDKNRVQSFRSLFKFGIVEMYLCMMVLKYCSPIYNV